MQCLQLAPTEIVATDAGHTAMNPISHTNGMIPPGLRLRKVQGRRESVAQLHAHSLEAEHASKPLQGGGRVLIGQGGHKLSSH